MSSLNLALVQAEPAMQQNVYYQPQQAMMMMPTQMMGMPFGGQFYQQVTPTQIFFNQSGPRMSHNLTIKPMIAAQHVGYQQGHRIPSPPQHGGPLPNNYGITQNTPVSAGNQV